MNLEKLFYPKSIAVVGASSNLATGKLPYFQLLKRSGYKGSLYPVNPAYQEIDGVKVFPSLDAIPDNLDLVIVSVPLKIVLETFKAAVKKGVGFVHFFTSGFSEIGNFELEKELVQLARKSHTRIVGPNCLGVLCIESKVTTSFKLKQTEPGEVAFLSQSGGISDLFLSFAQSRNIRMNKAVSYGNQIDIRVEDYLKYFGNDDKIKIIAAYIEDIKDGKSFLSIIKKITPEKLIIVLKGGSTEQGAIAAKSHTGAMSGPSHIFTAVMRQTGCILVETFEELLDVVMLATTDGLLCGPRVGFLGCGGGTSVTFTDLAAKQGLVLPKLNESTQQRIRDKISIINTSTTNPVDLGAFGFDFEIMAHTMKAMAMDDNLEVIIPHFTVGMLPVDRYENMKLMVDTVKTLKKPVIAIITKSTEDNLKHEEARIKLFSMFRDIQIPVYSTMQDAVVALRYFLQRRTIKENGSVKKIRKK